MSQSAIELFLKSCGPPVPLELEIVAAGSAASERRTFAQPFVLIGREERSPLRLDDHRVSRRHAYLQRIGGRVFCADIGSRTGVRWDGQPRSSGWLDPGQALTIGPFTIRLAGPSEGPPPGADWSPLARTSGGDRAQPGWTFQLANGSRLSVPWHMNRVLTLLGSSPACRVRLSDPSVSRFHSSLLGTPEGVWVVDLLSREGTYVNGERVPWTRLNPGDELTLGRAVLRVRRDAPAAPSPDATARGLTSLFPLPAPPAPLPLVSAELSNLSLMLANLGGQTAAGTAMEPARLQELLLVPVIAQFNLMQQQMFDQFNRTLLTLFQMFGNQQRDQMDLIRDELDRVRELTRELQTLQAELGKHPPPAAAPAPSPTAQNGHPLEAPRSQEPVRAADPPAPAPQPVAAATPEAPVENVPPPSGDAPDGSIHALLWQRMAAIEEERQGRWQKILNFLSGK